MVVVVVQWESVCNYYDRKKRRSPERQRLIDFCSYF